jgi:hypothetical protein
MSEGEQRVDRGVIRVSRDQRMRGDRFMPGARPGLICPGGSARGGFTEAIDSVGARCEANTGRQFGRGRGPVKIGELVQHVRAHAIGPASMIDL